MKAFQDLTKEQKDNHVKLLNYFSKKYEGVEYHYSFNMSSFCNKTETPNSLYKKENKVDVCGTSMCLLGYGPYAGIMEESLLKCNFSYLCFWEVYSEMCFGHCCQDGYDNRSWDFLFSDSWPDNPQEAIGRLTAYINGYEGDFSKDWLYIDSFIEYVGEELLYDVSE